MDQQEMKIIPPEGYEVDKENSTFECVRFKQIEPHLPKTWKEFCDIHSVKEEECWIKVDSSISSGLIRDRMYENDKNLLPSKKYAEAMLALCQLIQLRDYYNDGWQPDWSSAEDKECIEIDRNEITTNWHETVQKVLVFKSAELRNKFLENFKDLIEIAKPLL